MRQDFILYAEIEEYVRLRFASSDVYNTAILFGGLHMPYVIAEPCIGVKDKSCVAVCPVDCIHEADDQLYIDPSECIDCGLCEPECPVDAIFMEDEVPEQWKQFIQINVDLAKKA
jgi:NAD-dependent dihydropyrimidine dehydrogenase PreA subunit